MQVTDLKPNPKNPRKITDEKLAQLKRTLLEFGDLGGFVFNRKTGQLVGGHQRAKLFDVKTQIVIEKKYSKPTKTGTTAEGFAEFNGERFKYREVDWDEIKEKAANIAANKGAGEWDLPELSKWLEEIESFGFDPTLTMFDSGELEQLLSSMNPEFEEGTGSEQGRLDKKNPIECPHCHESFIPGEKFA